MSGGPDPCPECAERFYIGAGCPDDALREAATRGEDAARRVLEFRRFMAGAMSGEPEPQP